MKRDCRIFTAAIGTITIISLMTGRRSWLAVALDVKAIFEGMLVYLRLLVDKIRAGGCLLQLKGLNSIADGCL